MKTIKLTLVIAFLSIVSFTFAGNGDNNRIDQKDNTVVFYFIRHGKTMFNTMERAQGWSDTPLTPQGVEVAEFLGAGLKDITFKAAYSSDLGRARQTARIVLDKKGQSNLKLEERWEVRETNFGSYEGELGMIMWRDASLYLHYKDMKVFMDDINKKPGMMQELLGAIKALDKLGMAEDYNDVKARGQKAIKEIAAKEAANGGGNVMLVAHGMAIGIFLSDIDSSGKPAPGGHMGNAAVCKVTYKDGKFTLESFDDMSYVEKGKAMSVKK